MCSRMLGVVVGGAIAGLTLSANADFIFDASYFDSIPHTLIAFETDGEGNPVNLNQAQSLLMPGDEYAAQGVTFDPPIKWVNNGSLAYDEAQAIGGSLPIGINSPNSADFEIVFFPPVTAFGFWVVQQKNIPLAPVTYTAHDASGNVIDSAVFTKSAGFIDGCIDNCVAYGFMGIFSNMAIARVLVTGEGAVQDNLMFSPVLDCNDNGIVDADEIDQGLTDDCNDNQYPDECEIAEGSVPDCNGNGVPDGCDLAQGTSTDYDSSGTPDDCECLADVDGDGDVDIQDFLVVLAVWGNPGGLGDVNFDGTVGILDFLYVLSTWGPCP